MANGNRTMTLVIVLIVGLGVGWLIGRATAPTPGPVPVPTPKPTAVPPPFMTPLPTPDAECTPKATPAVVARNWKLFVGPDANNQPCLVVDEHGNKVPLAFVSKWQGHSITFRPLDKISTLEIVIHVPAGYPPPFRDVAPHGFDTEGKVVSYSVYCDDFTKVCSTGPALGEYGCYKYDQILNGKICDARIIIER